MNDSFKHGLLISGTYLYPAGHRRLEGFIGETPAEATPDNIKDAANGQSFRTLEKVKEILNYSPHEEQLYTFFKEHRTPLDDRIEAIKSRQLSNAPSNSSTGRHI